MTINLSSTSDSPEAVIAALGDLANAKPVEDKKEAPAEVDPKPDEVVEPEEPADEPELDEEKTEAEELEAKGDESQEKPKKKGGFQKRIDKMNVTIEATKKELDYWRTQALATKTPDPNVAATETKPDLSKKPIADDFKTHDEYVEALTDWKLEQKLSARDLKHKEDAVKNEVQTKMSKHGERVDEFKKSHSDFNDQWNDAIEEVGEQNLSLTVRQAIVDSDQGPALMYALSQDPKEFKRICALTPIAAAMALGKIEARLTPLTQSSEKKLSKAPAPVSPVRTRGAASAKSIYDESLSQGEYEKLRAEQLKTMRV